MFYINRWEGSIERIDKGCLCETFVAGQDQRYYTSGMNPSAAGGMDDWPWDTRFNRDSRQGMISENNKAVILQASNQTECPTVFCLRSTALSKRQP